MGTHTRMLMHAVSGVIALPAVVFAGRPFFRSAWNVLRRGRANMDVPISLAITLAFTFSIYETVKGGDHAYFDACAMLMFFLLIGRYLSARLARRAHAAAHELAALQSRSVTRLSPAGHTQSVRAADIAPGDMVLLASGERAVVDMTVVEGEGAVDESMVSGESVPRLTAPGATLFAGTINLGQALKGRVINAASASLLADIGRMLEAGEQRRSTYRRIADKAASLYVPFVHTTAFLAFVGWLVAGADLRMAVMIAVSTLIITCPCALALAAPVVQVVAAGRLFKAGVFLKSGDALERLATVDHVVFDKTGTLTLGEPVLIRQGLSDAELALAAQLARVSRHPLSRALVKAAGQGAVARGVTEHAGLGLEAEIDGETVRLGSATWVGISENIGEIVAEAGGPTFWLKRGRAAPVPFRFRDSLREDAHALIEGLAARGLTAEIVSGDADAAVDKVARELGIQHWMARATPTGKADRLSELEREGRKVLMVGDGLNDAGALSLAHASLSPGGAMDVSQAASDAVYAGDGLSAILTVIDTARSAKRGMMENFGLAALYNVIAVPIAVAGFATPLVAAVAMSASSLVVTLNALRLRARRP